MPNRAPNGTQKSKEILSKARLETTRKSTYARKVLKWLPSDLRKTSCRMKMLQKNTIARSEGKCKNGWQWNMGPWSSIKKRCLKTYPRKSYNIQKVTPRSVPESDFIFRDGACWGTFGDPIHFLKLKKGPQRSQSASNYGKWTKDNEEPQDCGEDLKKSSQFGAWPVREALI